MSVTVELTALEIFGHHGVGEEERRDGQPFLYDISYDVSDGSSADRLEDTVDYRAVAACVRDVSDTRSFRLLEALAAAVADAIAARFDVERVRVRVRKPGVRLADPVAYTAATVERSR